MSWPATAPTASWSASWSVQFQRVPRVFLKSPKAFRSDRVCVTRIGMFWRSGKIPTTPPVDWSWRCNQFSRRACSSVASTWKSGVSCAMIQSNLCLRVVATHLARRLAAMYLAAFSPCTNGWLRKCSAFGSLPTMHRRALSWWQISHSNWLGAVGWRCRLLQVFWPQLASLVWKDHEPAWSVGNPCKKDHTSCDMLPCLAWWRIWLSQASSHRCSRVSSNRCGMASEVCDQHICCSALTWKVVFDWKGFW